MRFTLQTWVPRLTPMLAMNTGLIYESENNAVVPFMRHQL
jgi:hypothetical protein